MRIYSTSKSRNSRKNEFMVGFTKKKKALKKKKVIEPALSGDDRPLAYQQIILRLNIRLEFTFPLSSKMDDHLNRIKQKSNRIEQNQTESNKIKQNRT